MAETSYIIQNGRRLNLKDITARKTIGSCDSLQTETKHCLVDAINEVNRKVGSGGGSGGEKGDPGATFTPSVDSSGNLSWTNNGGLENPETVNIKGPKGDKGDPGSASNVTNVAYGTCSTAADVAAKVITVSGNAEWTLAAGSIITVKFTATNTAQNPTFNVNGTGAKSVWYNTALITTGSLSYAGYANRTSIYVYDGTQYVFLGWSIDANTTYSNASLGQGYGTCSTAAATIAKVVTLSSYSLTTGGIVAVKFTYAVPANATMNINSKGAKAIYYRGAAITAGIIAAGDIATFIYNGSQYHLLSIDRGAIGGGVQMDLLWTNASPSSAFSAQTISVNSAGYTFVCIVERDWTGSDRYQPYIFPKTLGVSVGIYLSQSANYCRSVDAIADNSITFGNCVRYSDNATTNGSLIPFKIYGIK